MVEPIEATAQRWLKVHVARGVHALEMSPTRVSEAHIMVPAGRVLAVTTRQPSLAPAHPGQGSSGDSNPRASVILLHHGGGDRPQPITALKILLNSSRCWGTAWSQPQATAPRFVSASGQLHQEPRRHGPMFAK